MTAQRLNVLTETTSSLSTTSLVAMRPSILSMASTAPMEVMDPTTGDQVEEELPWVVLVWNDPINLMSYVTHVFQKLFGYSREKAEQLMHQVHFEGKAAVSSGTRAEAERDVFRLHEHGLWATMQQD